MVGDHSLEEGVGVIPGDGTMFKALTVTSDDKTIGISPSKIHTLKHKLFKSSVYFCKKSMYMYLSVLGIRTIFLVCVHNW